MTEHCGGCAGSADGWRGGDVILPPSSVLQLGDKGRRDTEPTRDGHLSDADLQQPMYVGNYRIGHLLPFRSRHMQPSLPLRIAHVVALRPEEEMIRIDAGGHVAGVQHRLTVRDRTVGECPRDAVGEDWPLLATQATTGHAKLSVAIARIDRPSPEPAPARPIDLRPEAICISLRQALRICAS